MKVIALVIEQTDRRRKLAQRFRRKGFAVLEATSALEFKAFVVSGLVPALVFIDLFDVDEAGGFARAVKLNLNPVPVWVAGFRSYSNVPEEHDPLPDKHFCSVYFAAEIVRLWLEECGDNVRQLPL